MGNSDDEDVDAGEVPRMPTYSRACPWSAVRPKAFLERSSWECSRSRSASPTWSSSREFYEKLGFEVTGGDAAGGWLILKNSETTLGLFSGMFEGNMLTFNPGLTPRMERIESFTDVREIAATLEAAGVEMIDRPEGGTTGPGSVILCDPDGNQILIDQFF